MRTDVVRTYKDIHTWVGIISGLALFIAFYAGAITMFEENLQRWATPPAELVAAPALPQTAALIEATLAAHPEAASGYQIHLQPRDGAPWRMTWRVREADGAAVAYGSSLAADASLQVARIEPSEMAQLIDTLHQQVGLPFEHEISMPIMGVIALLYGVALVSGVIIFLPAFAKDLFQLRIGKNLKRLWLDLHNVLGVFSLPFHLVMAFSAVVFAFHDQIYLIQDKVVYQSELQQLWRVGAARTEAPGEGVQPLAPDLIVRELQQQAPDFIAQRMDYSQRGEGPLTLRIWGYDPAYGARGATQGYASVDPYNGAVVNRDYLPGHQSGWEATISGFFALHFGNYGGVWIKWAYFALGMAGAFLFYSGNLLWLESRRKRQLKKAEPVSQNRSARIMGALTVGVSLGCVMGISITIAAAKWLPGLVENVAGWHSLLYYGFFVGAVVWALWRGAGRAVIELIYASALASLLIPLTSLLGWLEVAPAWHYPGWSGLGVDFTALLGAMVLLLVARRTASRIQSGAGDSLWALPPAEAPVETGSTQISDSG